MRFQASVQYKKMMHSGRSQISQLFRSTKMRVALVLLAVLACGLALPKYHVPVQNEDIRQQHVYDLLKYINNPMYHEEFLEMAQNFDLESYAQHYKTEAYQNFLKYFHHDKVLKKGEIFSIFNQEHMHQAKALFKLFYYADSYEVFHHTAVWARHHFNEGLFLYSYCVAIAHRPDTQSLVLPPVYELFPNYFFNSEVLQEAYKLKMTHSDHLKQQDYHTVYANYSGFYLNLDPEQSLSYYLEDVGLNAFYFYFNIYYPYWMESDEFHLNHKRGEIFYNTHKLLYARYHLERLSHGLGEVEYFNWDLPFKTGYYPSLTYPNGLPFPERPHFANLREYLHYYGQRLCDRSEYSFDYTYVQTYEQRIREAIDSGIVHDHEGNTHQLYSEEGINILGNIIEGNADSPNHQYYGSYLNMARHLLGYSKHPLNHHKLAPSALEHFSTSLRDPAFYHIFKKVFVLLDQFQQNMPHYQHKHLYQNGLKIENVEFDKLVTYYDHFLSEITNGLYVTPEEYEQDTFRVKVHQYRLNHENFNYKVHVKAEKATRAAVKVFIGPKYDEHGRSQKLSQVYDKLFPIDNFVRDLKVGDNVITRNSDDCYWFVKDKPSFFEGYHNGKFSIQHGLPARFKLPRGSEEGTSFQVYVIVYPYVQEKTNEHQYEKDGLILEDYFPVDSLPLGYPFDRPTENEDVYHVPNAFVKHVKVYHQVNQEILHKNTEEDSSEHQVDTDVYQQRGDHNNYHVYHYKVEDNDDQKKDSVYHGQNYVNTNKYQSYGLKTFFQDLAKYPGLYKHTVYVPSYKNYQAVEHGMKKDQYDEKKDQTHVDNQNLYDDDQSYDKYQKHETYGGDQHYPKYQKHSVYSENQDYDKYQKVHGVDSQYNGKYQIQYGSDDDQYYGKYQKHSVYGDDQDYDKYQKVYGVDSQYNGKYQKQYGSDDDQYYRKYQKHGFGVHDIDYKYQGQYNDLYHKTGYGKAYDTKYAPYQDEDQVKYGYGKNYQTSSEEHHGPMYHHY